MSGRAVGPFLLHALFLSLFGARDLHLLVGLHQLSRTVSFLPWCCILKSMLYPSAAAQCIPPAAPFHPSLLWCCSGRRVPLCVL
ncbi:hypothetical protein CALVIDRAFT_131846 [Calocera viscosa TUFC12733]|uniref:Secreted protein n=1 Tax=Calocera viscosa (strain TUFC12733) TaxID=1330018 RepID=A0A167RVE4_CALVF|nr:hypothetical protein CALVIDRAFT_131846 [Calocera viscosa TUFC12733]